MCVFEKYDIYMHKVNTTYIKHDEHRNYFDKNICINIKSKFGVAYEDDCTKKSDCCRGKNLDCKPFNSGPTAIKKCVCEDTNMEWNDDANSCMYECKIY